MKKKIKINFSDFWPGFIVDDNLLINLLRQHYDVEISNKPDILIYSCYSFNHINYKCYKIFFTGENVRPNFFECDFALTFDYNSYNNKNIRLPLYRWRGDLEKLCDSKNATNIFSQKRKFCCMLVSNPNCKERNQFFHELSKYKKVDSGGRYLNNIGFNVVDKLNFIKDYKFVLSFENSSFPGYTTEKLVEPFTVNSIPVYWGNNKVSGDFNSKSFINVHDYNSFSSAIEEIIRLDKNDEAYKSYIDEPYFLRNEFPYELKFEIIEKKMSSAIEKMMTQKSLASFFINRIFMKFNKFKKIFLGKILKKNHFYC